MTDSDWTDSQLPTDVVKAIRASLSEVSVFSARDYAHIEDFVYDGVASILGSRIREVSQAALTAGIREAIRARAER